MPTNHSVVTLKGSQNKAETLFMKQCGKERMATTEEFFTELNNFNALLSEHHMEHL